MSTTEGKKKTQQMNPVYTRNAQLVFQTLPMFLTQKKQLNHTKLNFQCFGTGHINSLSKTNTGILLVLLQLLYLTIF